MAVLLPAQDSLGVHSLVSLPEHDPSLMFLLAHPPARQHRALNRLGNGGQHSHSHSARCPLTAAAGMSPSTALACPHARQPSSAPRLAWGVHAIRGGERGKGGGRREEEEKKGGRGKREKNGHPVAVCLHLQKWAYLGLYGLKLSWGWGR